MRKLIVVLTSVMFAATCLAQGRGGSRGGSAAGAHRAVADFAEDKFPAAVRSPAAGLCPGVPRRPFVLRRRGYEQGFRRPFVLRGIRGRTDGVTEVVMPAAIADGVGAVTEADTTGEAGPAAASASAITTRITTEPVTTPLITTTGIMATRTTGMIRTRMTRMLMTPTLMVTPDTMQPRFAVPEYGYVRVRPGYVRGPVRGWSRFGGR